MTLFGDWDRGHLLIKKAIKFNPYYNVNVHHALWYYWLKQKNYQQAYLETLNFRSPHLFWDPLIKAATLGLLGRIEEGRQAAEDLLILKPGFQSRGRLLIGNYIKINDLVERVLDGLNEVGLSLE